MSLSRRRFLQNTAVFAPVAATAWNSSLLFEPLRADEVRSSANDSITCAMIGVGGRGRYLMDIAAGLPGVSFASVCDVNAHHRNQAASQLEQLTGDKKRPIEVDDFRRVLDDDTIDAVIVATPHHWHCPIAVRAVAAGKHVYVEKPASHVLHEGRLLVESARRNKTVVQHGTQMRSSEVTSAAGKVLQSGLLGQIKQAKAWGVEPRGHHPSAVPDAEAPQDLDYDFWLGPAPWRPFNPNRFRRWNSYRDYGNGEIGGDGIHDIDMARWGLGVTTHPVRIAAIGTRSHLQGESDFPDNLTAVYEYDDGRTLIYENRNFAPYKMHGWDNGNVFYGTGGYMIFSRRGYFQTYLGADEEKGPGLRGGAGNEEHVANFFNCIRDGKATSADAQIAHLSCGLVHLGEIAYRTNRTLQFDPQTEQFPQDEEASALLTKSYRNPWAFTAS